MKKSLLFFLFFSLNLLVACGSPVDKKKGLGQRYEVKNEALHKTLYFTGTIQPLGQTTVTSPVDAVIEAMPYHYGQALTKSEIILRLNSSELQKQYNDVLTDYLKAKDSFSVAKAKFTGTQELWDAGLLAKNNYLSEKSNLDTARVSLMQATSRLSDMLAKMDEDGGQNLASLSIAEFDKVRQALTANHNLISLKAPATGVLLYPPKTGDDKTNRLTVGSTVKAGQVIGLIGDLTGVTIEIDIPEIDIDKIHPGMKATITGVALGKEVLEGQLISVNAQASSSAGGSLPSFSAVVAVKTLSESQRPWVKVGMSAAIALHIDTNEQLLVPIAALKQEKGHAIVKILNPDGSLNTKIVATGAAQADKVVIASGLQAGDVVVYD